MNTCDKCGKIVLYRDDARYIMYRAVGNTRCLSEAPRHIQCSPSRAQFIPMLRINDNRPETCKASLAEELVKATEERWTLAYLQHIQIGMPSA